MKSYRKLRIQPEYPNVPGHELIVYKNRWGHYVWRTKDIDEDKNWPGSKLPATSVGVECIDDIWYWKLKEEANGKV